MTTYRHFSLEKDDDNILWLTFDREGESVNSLSREVFYEFDSIIEDIKKNPPAGVVLQSGKRSGFIAGADITQFRALETEDQAFDLVRQAQIVLDKLEALTVPTVALIDGFCLGGGTEVSLACRYRIMTDSDKTFMGLPEIFLGIPPGWGGTVRLPLLVGPLKAIEMILSGRRVKGYQAKKMGLADECVPLRELKRAARYYVLEQPKAHQPSWQESVANSNLARPVIGKMMLSKLQQKNVIKAHYPAPYAVIRNWVRDGARGNAMINEAKTIAQLIVTDTARNLARVFFLRTAMKKAGKGSDFKAKHVHVIGAGAMGGDIAAWCALRGLHVTLQDQSPERIAPALGRAYKLYKKKLKIPRLIQCALDRLQPDVDGRGIGRADVIIEAVFEDLKVKQDIFKHVEAHAKPEAILATNTSSIPLEEIATAMQHKQRLVGIHFFNPVAKMELVEVIRAEQTEENIVRAAASFVSQIGRLPVVAKSSPGFLVNRLLMPYLMEALRLLEEGYSPTVIDKAAIDFGMRMGPITLADMVGLDILLHAGETMSKAFGGQMPKKLEEMVAAGHLGIKSGQGFYEYDKKGKPIKQQESAVPADMDVITDRLILPVVNEAVACLHEKVVEHPDDVDAGMIFGTGFAPFRGGPIQYARTRGPQEIIRTLESLVKRFGERFKPKTGWELIQPLQQSAPKTVEPTSKQHPEAESLETQTEGSDGK